MANDINKQDPHYKGEFGSIYEVNRKFPTGGVAGDFVVIDGWAHYWNADRGTWCVNAERDSYWDELMTNISNSQKSIKEELGKKADAATVEAEMTKIKTSVENEAKERKVAIEAEAQARAAAIEAEAQARAAAIAAEEQARTAAIASEAQAREQAISAEATARSEADQALQASMDENVKELKGNVKDLKGADTQHENRLLALEQSEWPLSLELTLTPSLLEYTGSEKDASVSWKLTRKGAELVPTELTITQDGKALTAGLTASGSINAKVNKLGDTQFEISATADSMQKTVVSKLTMVLPIYCGFGTSETDVAIDANKQSPRTSASGTYAKTSAKDDVNFIILAPKTLPKLTNFTMGGAPFVMETTSVTINGKDYYMYKSGAIYMNGATLNVQAN
mgnify:CR=1 FL=1